MQNRSISFYFDISMDFYYYSQLVITIYSKKGRIYSSNILINSYETVQLLKMEILFLLLLD